MNRPLEPAYHQIRGVRVYDGFLSQDAQNDLCEQLRKVAAQAPFFQPVTPSGRKMSVKMTSAGKYGWYTDRTGYRYRDTHPDGQAWPAIPTMLLDIWRQVTGLERVPDCCLVNYYSENAKMGLHQDKDEADFSWPVVSVSLGDRGLFRIGNLTRGGSTDSIWLNSGDVVMLGGEARLLYHGIDRIEFGTSPLLKAGGRLNITMRVVT